MKTFSFNLKSFLLSIHTTLRTRWDPKGHLNSFHRSRVLFCNSCRRSLIHPHFSTGNKELRSLGTGTLLLLDNAYYSKCFFLIWRSNHFFEIPTTCPNPTTERKNLYFPQISPSYIWRQCHKFLSFLWYTFYIYSFI